MRKNDRGLTTTDGTFVANRDTFDVLRFDHGRPVAARVNTYTARVDHENAVTLPTWHAATQVELAYAGTGHAGQGGTRLAGHALVDARMDRHQLYVAMTRDRSSDTAYVTSTIRPNVDQEPQVADALAAVMDRADQPYGNRCHRRLGAGDGTGPEPPRPGADLLRLV